LNTNCESGAKKIKEKIKAWLFQNTLESQTQTKTCKNNHAQERDKTNCKMQQNARACTSEVPISGEESSTFENFKTKACCRK